jgi:hypothetical protein
MLDVIYTTHELGIGFCVSLKRGASVRRAPPPTFRMRKIDEELRNEASGYHQRQPFAVMIATSNETPRSSTGPTARILTKTIPNDRVESAFTAGREGPPYG